MQQQLNWTIPAPGKVSSEKIGEDILNMFASVVTNRSGVDKPSDIQEGEMWCETDSEGVPLGFYIWRTIDGSEKGTPLQEIISSTTAQIGKSPVAIDNGEGSPVFDVTVKTAIGVTALSSQVNDLTSQIDLAVNDLMPKDLLMLSPQIFTGTFSGVHPIGRSGKVWTNWQICDGTNGTPDLRDRFVLGGHTNTQWQVGGHTVTHHHTLAVHEMPGHSHGGVTRSGGTLRNHTGEGGNAYTPYAYTDEVGGWVGHAHIQNLPPFYKFAYIMKIA